MTNCRLVDFDITIRGGERPFSVTARYEDRHAEGSFDQDATHAPWPTMIDALLADGGLVGSADLQAAGTRLFGALVQDEIRDLWVQARADLDADDGSRLRMRLALQPPAVAALPWEALYDPDRNYAFAASGRTPLVRVENLARYVGQSRALRAGSPLKVMIAAPDDPNGTINADAEAARIKRLFDEAGESVAQVSTLTGRFDVVQLRRALEAERPDILHVIAHGEPHGLLLWQNGAPTLARAEALRTALASASSVKLVVLNACLAGTSSAERPFTTVGPQLLQAGVPAVIGMQIRVREDRAVELARYLYEELLTGPCAGAIDVALATARSNLYMLYPDEFAYGAPVLWLNARDGHILHFDAVDDRPQTVPPISLSSLQLIDIEEREIWLTSIMERLPADVSPAMRSIHHEARRLSVTFRQSLHQLRYLQTQEPNPTRAATHREKADEIQELGLKIERLVSILFDQNEEPDPGSDPIP